MSPNRNEQALAQLRLLSEYLTVDEKHEVALHKALEAPLEQIEAELLAAGIDVEAFHRRTAESLTRQDRSSAEIELSELGKSTRSSLTVSAGSNTTGKISSWLMQFMMPFELATGRVLSDEQLSAGIKPVLHGFETDMLLHFTAEVLGQEVPWSGNILRVIHSSTRNEGADIETFVAYVEADPSSDGRGSLIVTLSDSKDHKQRAELTKEQSSAVLVGSELEGDLKSFLVAVEFRSAS